MMLLVNASGTRTVPHDTPEFTVGAAVFPVTVQKSRRCVPAAFTSILRPPSDDDGLQFAAMTLLVISYWLPPSVMPPPVLPITWQRSSLSVPPVATMPPPELFF